MCQISSFNLDGLKFERLAWNLIWGWNTYCCTLKDLLHVDLVEVYPHFWHVPSWVPQPLEGTVYSSRIFPRAFIGSSFKDPILMSIWAYAIISIVSCFTVFSNAYSVAKPHSGASYLFLATRFIISLLSTQCFAALPVFLSPPLTVSAMGTIWISRWDCQIALRHWQF